MLYESSSKRPKIVNLDNLPVLQPPHCLKVWNTLIWHARFRVALVVQAEGFQTTFVIFDRATCKLTNKTAEEMTASLVKDRLSLSLYKWNLPYYTSDFDITILYMRLYQLSNRKLEIPLLPRFQAIPQCLYDLVGKTYDFQIKTTNFNFTASFQSFTVTRVTSEIPSGGPIVSRQYVCLYVVIA